MAPDFSLIGYVIRYRLVIQFIGVVDIVSGVAAFLLDLLRLTKFTAKVLPLAYAGIWIGVSWISTGCLALLASTQPSHYGQRLRKYVIGLLLLGTLSLTVCCIVIIAISYFPPSLNNYVVHNHTNLNDIDMVPFLTASNPGDVQGMIIIKSLMVILSTIKLFNACCELTFGVMQFKSGYFDFLEYWTKVPVQKLVRARTFPHSAKSIRELAKEELVDKHGRTNLMRMKSAQPALGGNPSGQKKEELVDKQGRTNLMRMKSAQPALGGGASGEELVDKQGRTNLMRMTSAQPAVGSGASSEKQKARKVMSVPI